MIKKILALFNSFLISAYQARAAAALARSGKYTEAQAVYKD